MKFLGVLRDQAVAGGGQSERTERTAEECRGVRLLDAFAGDPRLTADGQECQVTSGFTHQRLGWDLARGDCCHQLLLLTCWPPAAHATFSTLLLSIMLGSFRP